MRKKNEIFYPRVGWTWKIGPASRTEEVIYHSFSLSHRQFVLGFQFQFHCFYKLHSNLFLNFCCFCKQIYGQEALEYVPITLHECSALYFFLLFIYFVFCSFSLLDLWENLGKCSCIVPDLELKMLIRAYNLVFKLLASYFVPHYFILFF